MAETGRDVRGPASGGASTRPLEFLAPQHRDDPYPLLRRLREAEPVARAEENLWVISRFEDCRQLLRDPRFSSDARRASDYAEEVERSNRGPALAAAAAALMVYTDPPDHTRLRGLVQKAFTPRRIESFRPRVQAIVDELLAAGGAPLDVVADLASPLPFTVIAEMLGTPPGERERFRDWSRDLALVLEPALTSEMRAKVEAGAVAISGYIRPQIDDRREHPRDDLLTALVQAEEEGDRLNDGELGANVVQLLIAGHETTQNLIANGLWALLRHPEQLEALRAQPSLVPGAVEELLRYDPPVQFAARVALSDVELAGHTIPPARG